jgi:molybdate transport system permease protein
VRRAREAGYLLPALVLGLFLGAPVAALIVRATLIGPGTDPGLIPAVADALALSLLTTSASLVIALALGSPLAYALARGRVPGRRVVETVIDLPIVLPPSVAGLALLLVLGRRGPVGAALEPLGIELAFTTAAVVLAQVFVAAPFYVRSARTGFASVDRDLEDAARVDGAGELAVFRHVTLPLAAPAVASGAVMAWSRALGEFGATIMFAGSVAGLTRTLPLLVYAEFGGGSLDAAVAAGAVLVAAAFAVLLAVRLIHWRPVGELRGLA